MDGGAPNPDKVNNNPNRPTRRRVAPNATPQERLADILRRIGADQSDARKTYNPGAVEFRPTHRGGGGVGPTTTMAPQVASYNPYSSSPINRVPSGIPATNVTHAPPPQLFAPGVNYPTSGAYVAQGYTQGNVNQMYGSSGPGFPLGYAGGGSVMDYSSNGEFGPPAPPGVSQGPAQPAKGAVTQQGVIRGGRSSVPNGTVQKLSYECQARKFNPEFRVTFFDTQYTCDVLLKGRLIQGSKRYEDPQEAKLHTAAKALKEVKQWPLPGRVSSSLAGKLNQSPSDAARQTTRDQQGSQDLKKEQDSKSGGAQSFLRGGAQSQSPPGPSMASGVDMTDPSQARAFVEGYRMGQAAGARGSSNETQPDDTRQVLKQQKSSRRRSSRSRSPRRDRRENRGRRARSAARYFDGSRHDPALPSTDKYRPNSILVHRNVDKPKKDESYGRLKEEDYGA